MRFKPKHQKTLALMAATPPSQLGTCRSFWFRRIKDAHSAESPGAGLSQASPAFKSSPLADGIVPEGKKGFFIDSVSGFLAPLSYFRRPSSLLQDIRTIKSAVSGGNLGKATGIFVLSAMVSEFAALAGRTLFGAYLSRNGDSGTALGAALGGYLPAVAAAQIYWSATAFMLSAKMAGEGAMSRIRRGISGVKEAQRNIMKMIVRGTMLNIPLYGSTYLLSLGSAYLMGTAAAITAVNAVATVSFIFFTALALTMNKDVISYLAKKFNLPRDSPAMK